MKAGDVVEIDVAWEPPCARACLIRPIPDVWRVGKRSPGWQVIFPNGVINNFTHSEIRLVDAVTLLGELASG